MAKSPIFQRISKYEIDRKKLAKRAAKLERREARKAAKEKGK